MDATDQAYYLRRAVQEQEAVRTAACVEARERHAQLAAEYWRRCRLDSPAVGTRVVKGPEILRDSLRQTVGASLRCPLLT